jgi:histidinol-phosphate aminotransferase
MRGGNDFMKRSAEQLIRPDIFGMPAYQVANATGYIKLDAMENPYRLPSDLRSELGQRLAEVLVNRYPDASGAGLKQILTESFSIPAAAQLLLGNGSDEIITMVTQAMARPGASMLAFEPSFVMYRLNAQFSQLDYLAMPLNADFSLNLPATLALIQDKQPAVIFIAYPNNPTGNRFARREVEAILEVAQGLVVVDEAYAAFASDSFLALAGKVPNLLVMRTLSKLGMAGIRLGFAASTPAWIDALNKVRPPYNINSLTQEAASFLLGHRQVFDDQTQLLCAERTRLAEGLKAFSALQQFASEANFITVRVADADGLFGFLKQAGILIKNLHHSHPLLDQCLRITVGSPEENDAVLAALTAYFD